MNLFAWKVAAVEPWRDWRVGRPVSVHSINGVAYGQRKIARLTKSVVVLDNGVRFRRLDGTGIEITSFYIRCVAPVGA